ncbi:MAG: hypothetical protein LBL01_02595, partial [Bifidobacteriaceae bacterium]|nr:hypothetical protein [Bifidobacteriaceae bacterium]
MLGQFIAVIQGCAPAAALLAVIVVTARALSFAAAGFPNRPLSSQVALRSVAWGSGAGALAGAALAALRESAFLTSRELISATVAALFLASLAALMAFTWLLRPSARPAVGRTANHLPDAAPSPPQTRANSRSAREPGRTLELGAETGGGRSAPGMAG